MASTKLMTADELWELEDDGWRHELIRGELFSMPPTGESHGRNLLRLGSRLDRFIEEHDLGYGYIGDTGFFLHMGPDTLLAPDFAFVSKARAAEILDKPGFVRLVPELVVEVLSPSERKGHLTAKIQEYQEAGVSLIWLVDQRRRSITVHSLNQPTRTFSAGDVIDGSEVLPGFAIQVSDLFG